MAVPEPRLGTNPFCAAVPGDGTPAMLLDMATHHAAGKRNVAYNKGIECPTR